jgi:SAM-dependent methyltransferase
MDDIFKSLVISYDCNAEKRDQQEIPSWKKEIRNEVQEFISSEARTSLVDIGAGTGIHARFFQNEGIEVTCLDLSPAHIKKCQEKGLHGLVLNIAEESLDRKFDAAFAMNSLLHIPTKLLPGTLSNIAGMLKPGGIFYWGQYGGEHREGIYQDDHHEPKRFFNLLDDALMEDLAVKYFHILKFDQIQDESRQTDPLHFQSMMLRVRSDQN